MKQNRTEQALFFGAFVVKIFAFAFLFWWFVGSPFALGLNPNPARAFPVLPGDSQEYADLASNLLYKGSYTLSTSKPYDPESFRLPGYPVLLAGFEAIGFSTSAFILIQIFLSSISVVLIYRLGKRYLGNSIGIAAAVLLMFEPSTIFYSSMILSDPLFVFLLVTAFYLFFGTEKEADPVERKALYGALTGLFLGASVLVRVIGEFLPVIFIAFHFLMFGRKEIKERSYAFISKYIFFIIAFAVVIMPWSIRNHAIFGTYALSSTSDINFVRYTIPMFYAHSHDISLEAAYAHIQGQFPQDLESFAGRSLRYHAEFEQVIHIEISRHLAGYIPFHLEKTIPFFITDGLREINYSLHLGNGGQTEMVNFSDLLLKGNVKGIISALFGSGLDTLLLIVGSSFWAAISLLCLFSCMYVVWKKSPYMWFVLLSGVMILYFAVLTGPVSGGRYRMPAIPFMFLLASYGAMVIVDFISNKWYKLS
jgi:4-amino-4-deoxy-L-arabinose transferase-like glycosyltransferase